MENEEGNDEPKGKEEEDGLLYPEGIKEKPGKHSAGCLAHHRCVKDAPNQGYPVKDPA